MELHRLLPSRPSSAGAARRFASDALRECRQEALTDVTTLLVSELVTNALLHAGSQIGVRVRLSGSVLRVEVRDASPVLPLTRAHDDDATTGRGLEMVASLAADWGVEPLPRGKVVWFEIPASGEDGAQDVTHDKSAGGGWEPRGGQRPKARGRLQAVRLVAVPVRLCRAMQQHLDAVLRERLLMELGGPDQGRSGPDPAARALVAELGIQLSAELAIAAKAGSASADVLLRLPPSTHVGSRRLAAHLDEADDLARRGALLTPAALPEIRACRQWLLREIDAQLAGAAPAAWSEFAAAEHPGRDLWALVEHTPILDQLGDAVVVSDDENRIVHANPAVERLLGWRRADLVGRRLTTIVPERLREAHVAGFSRYLVTRQPHLIGRPARVPARRRDGSEVPVELLLTTFRSPDGRNAFVGSLRDLSRRDPQDAQDAPALRALQALHDVVATAAPDRRDLATLGPMLANRLTAALGWAFAAVWVADPHGGMRCISAWHEEAHRSDVIEVLTRPLDGDPAPGLPGRARTSGEPVWSGDVVAHTDHPRSAAVLEHGLRAGVAFPLTAGGMVVAVVELYGRQVRDADPALITVLRSAGAVVGALLAPQE